MVVTLAKALIAFLFLHSAYFNLRHYQVGFGLVKDKIYFPEVLFPLSLILKIICAISIIVGWNTQVAAILLAAFTAIATIIFHDFWNREGLERVSETFWLTSNLAIIGALLLLSVH